jgi:GR25 family glycosyltransferase involved in LPS biosynthesis
MLNKFVINITRNKNRKKIFLQNNKNLKNFKFFKGVDGYNKNLNPLLNKLQLFIDKNYKDFFLNRPLLNTEIGCFLSHYKLWKICVKINKPILILEDDAVVDIGLYKEKTIIKDLQKCDILFLGFRDLAIENNLKNKSLEYNYNLLKLGKHCVNTHAYCIKPDSAKKLIQSVKQNYIIPVDNFIHCTKTLRLGYKKQIINQIPRKIMESSIEPKINVLTVGTDLTKCKKLYKSLKKFNIQCKNLGDNIVWNGGDMTSIGGGQKLNLLKKHIKNLDDNDLILFTDAYDVFYNDNLETILERFESFNCKILFAAEKNCWPDNTIASKFPNQKEPYKYLNSGCFIGKVSELKKLLKDNIQDNADDQLFLQKVFLKNKLDIKLDYEQYIFVTSDSEVELKNNQLYNPITNCCGCIYHGNGDLHAKNHFKILYNNLFKNNKLFCLTNEINVNKIENDMFVLDFLSNKECNKLIKLAEDYGVWDSLDYDKFPAKEIRLYKLGLLSKLQEKFEKQITPILENLYKPVEIYGIRDAFITKYSIGSQTSLPLHNDASLVTISIKLNDNYQGGVLDFPRQNINNTKIEVGKALVFPGMLTHGHESLELTEGIKYSLTIWTKRFNNDWI